MDIMSIAALSVDMHQQKDAMSIGTAVMKMAMDTQTEMMDGMLDAMGAADVAAMTGIGQNIDIMA
ncbi:hypothetical protein D081_2048 [Anaerovibrio sp. JC8]|uniref:YjfB family protein n=1 Tax=Anaerovibrio sp. JC8 TaxID=1240085 RepID=UPI000A0E387E|nr:YjfB family protein [Anaerovibrio sp. JC8]ORT99319.1 hypothetical protein D081_2048 [Anaerovibrio sp. JC8]